MADYSETDWDHWIEVIETQGTGLTKWEEDFVASLRDQRERGRPLSDRQVEILERIYADKTP